MSNLVIVESPAKAKTIKKYLGGNYEVVASMGHVRDLPKSQLGIDVEHNFEPKYISIRGKSKLINSLKKNAKQADKVYLATDPDREGEAISWHLANLLGLDDKNSARVIFNEITKSAVQAGINSPRKIDMSLVDAQQARRVVDRLVGYKISPFLWRKIKKGLSAGRVQSVATKLIVDREDQIEAFKPEEYWTIEALLSKDGAEFVARFYGDEKQKIVPKNEAEARAVAERAAAGKFTVLSVKKQRKSKRPAPPFTTSTMQQEASKKLSMTSRRTMQIAQELYEGVEIAGHGMVGLITYMRTDSLRIAAEAQSALRSYIPQRFGKEFLSAKARFYKARSGAQDAHEAIRPTDVTLAPDAIKGSLSRDQLRLYRLIWSRFVASQMSDQVLELETDDVACDSGDNRYIFRATGTTAVFAGFSAVYADDREDGGKDEGGLPALAQGDALGLAKLDRDQHFTQPPARYTEATLIKTLEENGIGRPSTYAPTISTILLREYVVKEGKSFKPTALGRITTELMKRSFEEIVDVDFTANLEKMLDEVEEGGVAWKKVVGEFYSTFEKMLKNAESELDGVHLKVPDEVTDEICEKCGRNMVIKTGKFGKFLACPGYPECKNTRSLVIDTGAVCPKCGGRIVERKSKNGNKFYGCEKQDCNFMTWYQPTSKKCPVCGSALLKKNTHKKELLCSKEGCAYRETLNKNDE